MFGKVLIANRGEIACRIISSARRLGIRTVAAFSDSDRRSLHVRMADEAVCIGSAPAAASYLNRSNIVRAAKSSGVDAIHPGYGFLSENPDFAEDVERAGMIFVGPSCESIRAMGLKDAAKDIMAKAGVPVVPGFSCSGLDAQSLAAQAESIGFPVLVKAIAGGGGRGMRLASCSSEFHDSLDSARREAQSAFGNGALMVEKFVDRPRHIEVQVFGDRNGEVVHLFERDCSLQRRNQKLIEEAPAPGMPDQMRRALGDAAIAAARSIGYENAGTVEFIADAGDGLRADRFWFMEMNTRLQVEHPVTEMVSGLDLVEWQFRIAAGQEIPDEMRDVAVNGHAIEARIYAEDSDKGFIPASGRLTRLGFPRAERVDCGYSVGDEISPHYDSLVAKVIAQGRTRADALARLTAALDGTDIAGVPTNLPLLARLSRDADFQRGSHDTGLVERKYSADSIELEPPAEAIAVAAIGAVNRGRRSCSLSNFTLWIPMSRTVEFAYADRRYAAVVESARNDNFQVRFASAEYCCRLDHGSVWINGRKSSARLSVRGAEINVVFLGHWNFRVCDARMADSLDEMVSGTVHAPMPGVVKQVSVEIGQVVSKGEKLILLEAMKMEHSVVADGPGKVSELCIAAGDQVDVGQLLAVLEPSRAPTKQQGR
ncbi:MAG: ATP-grasp domain-containing protein [Albidovulum sp.]|nr:ATP-grasp domain-containing protein [Albidovulum sp.]